MECKDLLTETVHIIPVVFAVVTDVVVVVVVSIEKKEESFVIINLGQKKTFPYWKNKLVKHGNVKSKKAIKNVVVEEKKYLKQYLDPLLITFLFLNKFSFDSYYCWLFLVI